MNVSAPRTGPRSSSIASLIPTLAAASSRILPSAFGRPGAQDTGVAEHLGKALEEPFVRPLVRFFAHGCEALERRALEVAGAPFASCEPGVQDDLLREIQQDPHPFSRLFFEWLVRLTLEGFLCDPVHGGNRGQLGWQSIGYHNEEPRSGFCRPGEESR